MDSTLQILEQYLGTSKKSTHTKGHENYKFKCPFCFHHKRKLEVDIVFERWHCWVCNAKGKSIYSLLKQLSVPQTVLDKVRVRKSVTPKITTDTTVSGGFLQLPREFRSLIGEQTSHFAKIAKKYLSERGITEQDIQRYNIGYCDTGEYQDMIIIPSYNNTGRLNFFIGRSFNKSSFQKHHSPSVSKNIIGFELMINWSFPIVLCEGALDAITIRRNAIPLFGKVMSNQLKERIIQERPPSIYIALDPDASKDVIRESEYLLQNGLNVHIIDLNEGDPNEIGYEKFWKTVKNSKKLEVEDHFRKQIEMLL